MKGYSLHHNIPEISEHVASCLQLAILLEVSAPKPGNVNRSTDFRGTRYEHFLASAVAVGPSFACAAEQGIMISKGTVKPNEICLGKIIRGAVERVSVWQSGGNTLLGTILLLTPIAVAAGMTLARSKALSIPKLRENIKKIVKSTTALDSVAVYEAINIANPNGLIGKAPFLDVNDPKSKKAILRDSITLFDVFRISADYDSVSKEWVENYPVTFNIGFPYFIQQLEKTSNLNTAIVHTFLKVLSTVPDTLISRKAGLKKAKRLSKKAGEILGLDGLQTSPGREKLRLFDEELRKSANQYNPGTTADIIAAVLALTILNGYRP